MLSAGPAPPSPACLAFLSRRLGVLASVNPSRCLQFCSYSASEEGTRFEGETLEKNAISVVLTSGG